MSIQNAKQWDYVVREPFFHTLRPGRSVMHYDKRFSFEAHPDEPNALGEFNTLMFFLSRAIKNSDHASVQTFAAYPWIIERLNSDEHADLRFQAVVRSQANELASYAPRTSQDRIADANEILQTLILNGCIFHTALTAGARTTHNLGSRLKVYERYVLMQEEGRPMDDIRAEIRSIASYTSRYTLLTTKLLTFYFFHVLSESFLNSHFQ
jgi:hypothetical protein